MRFRVTAAGILSLQATLSLAADLPAAVTQADFPPTDHDLVMLGRDLFFDPILSGNKNIACATCHHPTLASADGLSLGLGEGAMALGPKRHVGSYNVPRNRIPRNAPALFNIGAYEFTVLFHDGRVQADREADFGFRMPKNASLERPVPTALAAQALMPPTSHDEMAGQDDENPIAVASGEGRFAGKDGVWDLLCQRVEAIPEYRVRFEAIFGSDRKMHFTDIARAIAEFETFEFQSFNSPFDRYLHGDKTALTDSQVAGMEVFYGEGNCSSCHSGPFQTDHSFHAIGLPQLGPGKEPDSYADKGRGGITGAPDRYRFRTPSLRNVAITGPYGHNGAYSDLESIVRHHLDPIRALTQYDRSQARLSDVPVEFNDWGAMSDQEEMIRIAEATEIIPVSLSEDQIADLLAFLDALTDPAAGKGRLGAPQNVPSGLPLDRAD